MDESFRTFLQSSKTGTLPKQKSTTPVVENKNVISSDPRTKILQDKVAYFCKKYGEIGADALDDFFKESVEKFSSFKQVKKSNVQDTVVESNIPMNSLERANAILMGGENPRPAAQSANSRGDDIMAKAMALMG